MSPSQNLQNANCWSREQNVALIFKIKGQGHSVNASKITNSCAQLVFKVKYNGLSANALELYYLISYWL